MSDNVIKRVFNAITNKSHTFSLTDNLTTNQHFGILSGVWGYLTGKKNFDEYTKAYGENPLVYMVVKKIAYSSASIKRIAVDEKDEPIQNSKVLDLLDKPNDDQGMIDFYEEIGEYLETTGNCFIRYVKGIGAGEELIILPTNKVEIKCDTTGSVTSYVYTNHRGTQVPIDKEDILHLRSSNIVNPTTHYGLSPLQAGWIVVKSSNEKLNADASIFKNRGIIGILTNETDVPMHKKERERLQSELDSEVGGSDRYNKVKISNNKLRYIQTGMSPTDLKLLEGILSSLRLICGLYGIPSVLFNDNDNSTFNNVSEAKKTAYTDVYIPLANRIDKALSMFLSEKLGVNETIVADLTSIEVLMATTNELAQKLNSLNPLLVNAVMSELSHEEVRSIVDLIGTIPGDERSGAQPTVNIQA